MTRRLEDGTDGAGAAGGRQVLDVFVIDPDIADMGEGEGHDLAGIGGIGEDLLVTRERGIEADLGLADAGLAKPLALDHGAVGEDEKGGDLFGRPGRGCSSHQALLRVDCAQLSRDFSIETMSAADHMTRLEAAEGDSDRMKTTTVSSQGGHNRESGSRGQLSLNIPAVK